LVNLIASGTVGWLRLVEVGLVAGTEGILSIKDDLDQILSIKYGKSPWNV
jgi:hypothetical protein